MEGFRSNLKHGFTNHKNQWLAFLAIGLIYGMVGGLTDKSLSRLFILAFVESLLVFVIVCGCLSMLLFISIRLFKRNYSFSGFVDALSIIAFVMMIGQIINLALNFVTRGK